MAGQVWGTNSAGGFMYADQLTTVLRTALQPMSRFQQHCDADDFSDKGYNKGDTFRWNVYSDVGTQGGRLSETSVMPETNFTITQGSGTISEFGNSVPYSGVLDDLSAQPVKQIIHKALKNDANKAFEAEARAQFAATKLTVTPVSGTSTTAITLETTGTATATNNVAMNTAHVKAIADQMKERNIPVYADGNYRAIGRPSTFRQVKNDLEAVHSYTQEGFGMILKGEVGRSYEGIRFFEQTTVASRAWTNAKSDEAFFFGEDTVIEAIVCPPEIRGKLPGDYGRDKGVAWYALEGFALVHTAAAQARIIKWASAA
jgi:N4-gp56 family major capsid protein